MLIKEKFLIARRKKKNEMNNSYLSHHGIKGQKWGVRRFQNEDGTLTSAGKSRYGTGTSLSGSKKRKLLLPANTNAGKFQREFLKSAALSTIATVATGAALIYVTKHPEIIEKCSDFINKNKSKSVNDFAKETKPFVLSLPSAQSNYSASSQTNASKTNKSKIPNLTLDSKNDGETNYNDRLSDNLRKIKFGNELDEREINSMEDLDNYLNDLLNFIEEDLKSS